MKSRKVTTKWQLSITQTKIQTMTQPNISKKWWKHKKHFQTLKAGPGTMLIETKS